MGLFTLITVVSAVSTVYNAVFQELFLEVKSKLESLAPLIQDIERQYSILVRDDKYLNEARELLENGNMLMISVTTFNKGIKKPWKNFNCKPELEKLDKSLTTWLEILPGHARDLRIEVLERQQISAQRIADEAYCRAGTQIQPFLGWIQSWTIKQRHRSKRFVLMILVWLSMVMAAGAFTGTKWSIFNIGINYSGINNN